LTPAAPYLAAVIGAVVGSFLNVVIYRVAKGESIVFPGSHCPNCGHALSWYENVPVLSWLALRGRCAHCRAPISVRYPTVEALTAALFALAVLEYGTSWTALVVCLLSAVLIAVLFFDLDHLLIPDSFVIPCAIVAFADAISRGRALDGLEGCGVAGGALGLIYLCTRGRGMGLGDVKLAGAVGLALSAASGVALVAASFVVGACAALIVISAGSRGRRDALPFGPFIVVAAWLLLFVPQAAFAPYDAYRHWMEARWMNP
jgi:leader peptidase (prepilin peptidase) / N-methyltransferase